MNFGREWGINNMTLQIKKAQKFKLPARVCIWGIEKSGKTHAALSLATALAERETPEGEEVKVGVISSEYASSQLLQHRFPHEIVNLAEVDEHGNLVKNAFSPARYEEAIKLFTHAGYQAIVIDSLSHVWEGEGGILEAVSKKGSNSFNDGWGENTPIYKHLINTILAARCHIVVTLRSKEEYKQEEYTKRNGDKGSMPKNVGQAPIIRKNFGYEMHLKLRMDSMIAHVEATAMQDYIPKGEEIENVGDELASRLLKALDGVPLPEPSPQQILMRHLLEEFYNFAPATYDRIAGWETLALRKALNIPTGNLPTEYTNEHVTLMDAYVALKRTPVPTIAFAPPVETVQPITEESASTITERQQTSIRKLCEHLGKFVPTLDTWSFVDAKNAIQQLSEEYRTMKQQEPAPTEQTAPPAEQTEETPEITSSFIRRRVATIKPTGKINGSLQTLTFEQFYGALCRKPFTSDDAITPAECELMNRRLDAYEQVAAPKEAQPVG
jgi:AAA domain